MNFKSVTFHIHYLLLKKAIFTIKKVTFVMGIVLIRVWRAERNSNVLSSKYHYSDHECLFSLMVHNPVHIFI